VHHYAFLRGLFLLPSPTLEATAAAIRRRISDSKTFDISYYDPSGIEVPNTPGTSHIVAADSSGLAISITTSINLLFGSQVIVPETGIIMNNEMNDFSIPNTINAFGYVPSPLNYIRPGARPLSSISPVIVDDPFGLLYFVTGGAGGSALPQQRSNPSGVCWTTT